MFAKLKLIRSTYTTTLLDKLSEHVSAGTLQRVCCQATKKKHKLWVKNFCYKLTKSRDGPVKSTETRQGWKHKKSTLLQKNCGKAKLENNSTSVPDYATAAE